MTHFLLLQSHRAAILPAALLLATCSLLACGGDDGSAAVNPVVPPAATTTVSGAVVKGPVSAAQVCAFAVAAGARGAALGACTTTDANGNYSFSVPAGSGPLWVQATGGSYVDEVSGTTVTLSAGSPLSSLVTANGAAVTTMLTPLTTLALNAARASVGPSGSLDAAAFATAVAQLQSAFNLPATFNLLTTTPTFGATPNAYGAALINISRMVAAGTALAQILAATQPSTLATAYAAAAAPVVVPPAPSNATASGTLTMTGSHAAVATFGNFTPEATGFEVTVNSGAEDYASNLNQPSNSVYRFSKTVNNAAGVARLLQFTITRSSNPGTAINVSYTEGGNVLGSCNGCAVLSTPSGASHPVTLTFANAVLVPGLTANGSLVGDAVASLWSPTELPGTTVGDAAASGVPFAPTDSTYRTFPDAAAKFILADGTLLEVTGNTALFYGRLGVYACFSNCGITAVHDSDGTGTTFSFANSRLALPNFGSADPAGRTLTGSITVRKSYGPVVTTSLGTFSVITSTVQAVNDKFVNTYMNSRAGESAGAVSIEVTRRGSQVLSVLAKLGFAGQGQTYACNAVATPALPACSGVSISSDGLTVLLSNTVLGGSIAVGGVLPMQTFTGNMVAKGR